MVSRHHTPTRRDVLRTVGAGIGAAGLAGVSSGQTAESRVVNVGYDAKAGRRTAERAAKRVVRRFEFDALTVEVGRDAISELRDGDAIRYVEPNGTVSVIEPVDGHGGRTGSPGA